MDQARLNEIAAAFELQARGCSALGSPLTAAVLDAIQRDLLDSGISAAILDGFAEEPIVSAVTLRMAGALHRAVLDGRALSLRNYYASVGGQFDAAADPAVLIAPVRATLAEERTLVDQYLQSPPQTNEVARSGGLLGGFLDIAARTGLPLSLLEIGASAGLNLFFDRFYYQLGNVRWGDPRSPVHLAPEWQGPLPPLDAKIEVVARHGTDIAPTDVHDDSAIQRLQSYLWPDQPLRIARFRGAVDIARRTPFTLDRESADTWLARKLSDLPAGAATVVFHSIFWGYMPEPVVQRTLDAIKDAGARATADQPLAWLAMEPRSARDPWQGYAVKLTLWPGGEMRVLADVHPHGAFITWQG